MKPSLCQQSKGDLAKQWPGCQYRLTAVLFLFAFLVGRENLFRKALLKWNLSRFSYFQVELKQEVKVKCAPLWQKSHYKTKVSSSLRSSTLMRGRRTLSRAPSETSKGSGCLCFHSEAGRNVLRFWMPKKASAEPKWDGGERVADSQVEGQLELRRDTSVSFIEKNPLWRKFQVPKQVLTWLKKLI
jgi:hypothetical protein